MSSEVYLSMIFTALDSGAAQTIPVSYTIEMPTKDKCALYGEKVAALFKPVMTEMIKSDCTSNGLQTFLKIIGRNQLIRITNDEFSFSGLSAVGVQKKNKLIEMSVMVNRDILKTLSAQARSLINDMLPNEVKLSELSIVIHNDTKNDVDALAVAAFFDREPILGQARSLKALSSMNVAASNVHNAALLKNGYALLFYIDPLR